jgi:hypothetical protein
MELYARILGNLNVCTVCKKNYYGRLCIDYVILTNFYIYFLLDVYPEAKMEIEELINNYNIDELVYNFNF